MFPYRAKELHLFMDVDAIEHAFKNLEIDSDPRKTIKGTFHSFECTLSGKVYTTLSHFLSFYYAERLFVHIGEAIHEITLGECEGINKMITPDMNLELMLLSGQFNWYRPYPDNNLATETIKHKSAVSDFLTNEFMKHAAGDRKFALNDKVSYSPYEMSYIFTFCNLGIN